MSLNHRIQSGSSRSTRDLKMQREEELQIDNKEGMNLEKQNIEEKPSLLVQTEPDVSKGNQTVQKLFRAPRYFEPQACDRRGEKRIKCKISKNKGRWKICYICGERGHRGKSCKQVKGCFICNKKGHLSMDCRNKNVGTDCASQLCLACGSSGHDMFSCKNEYDLEDLKAVECCVCRNVGHLKCVDNRTEQQTKASCYNCGETGHFGVDCPRLKDVRDSGENGHSQQPCEVTVGKVDVQKDELGAQPAKRQKSRRRGKRKKNKLTPTTMHPGWRPPIVAPYYGRPGSNVCLSYQATTAGNHLNPSVGNLPSYRPINHHIGTQVLNLSCPPVQLVQPHLNTQNGSQILQLRLNQDNLVLNVHGDEAIIPTISYPMIQLPHLNLQTETLHPPGAAPVPQNSYGPRPPLSHQNVILLPITTAQSPPLMNHETLSSSSSNHYPSACSCASSPKE